MKFLADKFAAVVVTAFRGPRISTKLLFVELRGTDFGVGRGNESKFEPSASCVYHRHHMDLVFDFVARRFGTDSNHPGAAQSTCTFSNGILALRAGTRGRIPYCGLPTILWR